MARTLYDKVFDLHVVRQLGENEYQLFVGLHLVHEATSADAFAMLRELRLPVLYPSRTFATTDHVVPTRSHARPFAGHAENLVAALERNAGDFGIEYFGIGRPGNGIVHVIAPELGLTQPGMTVVCGDSHTSTHGAFGALAFGVGTTQVRNALASQTVVVPRKKVRRIVIDRRSHAGVTAKDAILFIINKFGANAGASYVYEFAGEYVDSLTMDERMTICNMAVEGGALCGYMNPDETTFSYLQHRRYAPSGPQWNKAVRWWRSLASEPDALYDDELLIDASEISPMVTWGTNLAQSVSIDGRIPAAPPSSSDAAAFEEARQFMGFSPGQPIKGTPIDVAFLGSCTNARFHDFDMVCRALRQSGRKVAPQVRALAVPGSVQVRERLVAEGMARVLIDAGFEFRHSGCSMCVGINGDQLHGREVCASSSNRNFKGRQGSPNGRTLIMSPIMVAAAAVSGCVADARQVFDESFPQ